MRTPCTTSICPRYHLCMSFPLTRMNAVSMTLRNILRCTPKSTNQVASDSFIVHSDHLFMFQFFQFTGSEIHRIKSGLEMKCANLPEQDKWECTWELLDEGHRNSSKCRQSFMPPSSTPFHAGHETIMIIIMSVYSCQRLYTIENRCYKEKNSAHDLSSTRRQSWHVSENVAVIHAPMWTKLIHRSKGTRLFLISRVA
jgi:hypothetical protein